MVPHRQGRRRPNLWEATNLPWSRLAIVESKVSGHVRLDVGRSNFHLQSGEISVNQVHTILSVNEAHLAMPVPIGSLS